MIAAVIFGVLLLAGLALAAWIWWTGLKGLRLDFRKGNPGVYEENHGGA